MKRFGGLLALETLNFCGAGELLRGLPLHSRILKDYRAGVWGWSQGAILRISPD